MLKARCPNIEITRNLGTISAFDVKNGLHLNATLKSRFLQEGLLIRPLGNTIYLLPLYSITTNELNFAYQKISAILDEVSS